MNTVMENILTRRSVRAFKAEPLPKEQLLEIAKAAAYAPSGMNRQTWKFTIVCNQEKIQRLAAVIETELDRKGYDFYAPAALIIPSNDAANHLGKDDNAAAIENMLLAAHSMEIGSVWINQLNGISDRPAVRTILTEWGIPENHLVYGVVALGYAADAAEKKVNKTAEINLVE